VATTGLVLLAVASGLLFSKVYWGYWLTPPSVLPWVQELRSAEAVRYVQCEPDKAAKVETVPESEIRAGALAYLEFPQHYPGYQLYAALHLAGIPVLQTAQTAPAPPAVQPICDRLFESSFIVNGDPGYQYARFIRGALVTGNRRSGEHTAILSAIGGEVSNDHHPVYDVQFVDPGSQQWQPLRHHVYFEDIAGVEGARWYVAFLFVFVAGTLFLTAASLAIVTVRFGARRLTSAWSRRRT
jgi:hypothetical protein